MILEVAAAASRRGGRAEPDLRPGSSYGANDAVVHARHVRHEKTGYLSINHQSQFPAATVFFNLAPGVSLGEAVTAINKAMEEIGAPNTLVGSFRATRKRFRLR